MHVVATGAIAIVLLALLPQCRAQSHPQVEAFAQLPEIDAAQLSPDGLHFAAIQSYEGKRAVTIYQVGGPLDAKPIEIPSGDWLIDGIKWAKNDRLVVTLAQNKRYWWDASNKVQNWMRAISVAADGSNVAALLKDNPSLNLNYRAANIVDLDIGDADHIFMPLWVYSDFRSPDELALAGKRGDDDQREEFTNDLFEVNVRTGEGVRVTGGGHDTGEWYLDGHGGIVARVDETERPLRDHLMLYHDGDWREAGVFDAEADKGAGVVGLAEDGKSLVVLRRDAQSMRILSEMDIASGKEISLYSNPTYDVSEPIVDEWTLRVVGATYDSDVPERVYFDPKREALQRGLEKAFPGQNVDAVSLDLAQDKVIVAVESPRNPTTYYFLDRTTHQASPIASTYPGLSEEDLGEMKAYPYKARDGLEIPAYLTLPPGRAPNNLPTVVMPHGGPDDRDVIGFDWQAQFLANRGYAVLQPNYRGSSGYGHKFTEAGLHQWGLKMQDDISDGVRKLIADGIADPKRICIVGASYGGYAALAGAAFTPDLYACAVSVSGVSDLPAMIREERSRTGKNSSAMSFWISRIGSPDDDSVQLRATSPARHADQVRCPVLLIHGNVDTTVPIAQSELMYDAMKSAGKDVELVRLEGDDHYLELASSRARVLSELEHFLAAHIGAAASPQK
jgi:dipeptidyl aminopeptidase/acylaminoacyl peptidase